MHAFLSNLANRQTDKRTRANAFTSSFVGGKKATHTYKQVNCRNNDDSRYSSQQKIEVLQHAKHIALIYVHNLNTVL